jgi:hypothetical protein
MTIKTYNLYKYTKSEVIYDFLLDHTNSKLINEGHRLHQALENFENVTYDLQMWISEALEELYHIFKIKLEITNEYNFIKI